MTVLIKLKVFAGVNSPSRQLESFKGGERAIVWVYFGSGFGVQRWYWQWSEGGGCQLGNFGKCESGGLRGTINFAFLGKPFHFYKTL